MSPWVFNVFMDAVIKEGRESGDYLSYLYTDDLVLYDDGGMVC